MTTKLLRTLLVLSALSVLACSSSSDPSEGRTADARPPAPDACAPPPLLLEDDGIAHPTIAPPLILKEVAPTEFIEIYNPNNITVDLRQLSSGLSDPYQIIAQFHAGLGAGWSAIDLPEDFSLPARQSERIPWPFGFNPEDWKNGTDLFLYQGPSNPVDVPTIGIMDYLCWDRSTTLATLDDETQKWNGECVMVAGSTDSIRRLSGSTGTTNASYEVLPAPSNPVCR
jgi:hypothetical protein